MMNEEPQYRWRVEGLEGHRDVFGNDFLYTSLGAPVEADEYKHMRERGEAAETRVAELERQLAAVPTNSIYKLFFELYGQYERGPVAVAVGVVGEWLTKQPNGVQP